MLMKLREQYMTMELASEVLEKFKGHFLYAIMEKDFLQGKINKYLQVYIDRRLLEQFN